MNRRELLFGAAAVVVAPLPAAALPARVIDKAACQRTLDQMVNFLVDEWIKNGQPPLYVDGKRLVLDV